MSSSSMTPFSSDAPQPTFYLPSPSQPEGKTSLSVLYHITLGKPFYTFLHTGTNLKVSYIFFPGFWPGTHNILSFSLWFTFQNIMQTQFTRKRSASSKSTSFTSNRRPHLSPSEPSLLLHFIIWPFGVIKQEVW